jgi:hypothetical protein
MLVGTICGARHNADCAPHDAEGGWARIDPEPQIGYLHTMIANVPTFVSTMMPLSIQEAEPFGM